MPCLIPSSKRALPSRPSDVLFDPLLGATVGPESHNELTPSGHQKSSSTAQRQLHRERRDSWLRKCERVATRAALGRVCASALVHAGPKGKESPWPIERSARGVGVDRVSSRRDLSRSEVVLGKQLIVSPTEQPQVRGRLLTPACPRMFVMDLQKSPPAAAPALDALIATLQPIALGDLAQYRVRNMPAPPAFRVCRFSSVASPRVCYQRFRS